MKALDLDKITLAKGAHNTREEGMCAMEAAAYIAGQPHSDQPPCVCPSIGDFLRTWNDDLSSDGERDRLIKPLLPHIIGTASTKATENRRRWIAFDWLVRINLVSWLRLAKLTDHADKLVVLNEITNSEACAKAMQVIKPARAAARDAAGAAARDALKATVTDLQHSAVALVRAMCTKTKD